MTRFLLNGESITANSPGDTPLVWVIRDELKLKGTKFGCGIAQCGACTIQVDGVPTRSCVTRLEDVAGLSVTTIEGLNSAAGEALKTSWIQAQVPQCGYCQSGQLVNAEALLRDRPSPSDEQITQHMSGNLCRCMTYARIHRAIKIASSLVEDAS
ncbi:MAG: (2Fe-2S)-binding protein [Congregibacter sp.]